MFLQWYSFFTFIFKFAYYLLHIAIFLLKLFFKIICFRKASFERRSFLMFSFKLAFYHIKIWFCFFNFFLVMVILSYYILTLFICLFKTILQRQLLFLLIFEVFLKVFHFQFCIVDIFFVVDFFWLIGRLLIGAGLHTSL